MSTYIEFGIEEIDFSKEHKQDYRNWSKDFKSSSGRLMVDESFRRKHQIEDKKMSYTKTKKFIANLKGQDK